MSPVHCTGCINNTCAAEFQHFILVTGLVIYQQKFNTQYELDTQ